MPENIKVSPELLKQGSKNIGNLAIDYETQYKKIFEDVERMHQMWDGDDNRAYTNAILPFRSDLQELAKLLQQISAFLGQAAKAYADNQQSNVAGANRLRG